MKNSHFENYDIELKKCFKTNYLEHGLNSGMVFSGLFKISFEKIPC